MNMEKMRMKRMRKKMIIVCYGNDRNLTPDVIIILVIPLDGTSFEWWVLRWFLW